MDVVLNLEAKECIVSVTNLISRSHILSTRMSDLDHMNRLKNCFSNEHYIIGRNSPRARQSKQQTLYILYRRPRFPPGIPTWFQRGLLYMTVLKTMLKQRILLNVNTLQQGKLSVDTTLQIDRLDGSHDAVKANAPVVDVVIYKPRARQTRQ